MAGGEVGSPPLTRGPRWWSMTTARPSRITPAYAGTTVDLRPRTSITWDHPRLRGDHSLWLLFRLLLPGSPPLTRGPRSQVPGDNRQPGITPAYAGTTKEGPKGPVCSEDHPRLRGDHYCSYECLDYTSGSPPLTRGPPVGHPRAYGQAGITPAYAGTTSASVMSCSCWRDHPRLRGDHHSCSCHRDIG